MLINGFMFFLDFLIRYKKSWCYIKMLGVYEMVVVFEIFYCFIKYFM